MAFPAGPSQPWVVALLVCFLAAIVSGPIRAETGINLSWDDCGTFGSPSASFACNTNAGSHSLVGSFAVSEGVVDLVGITVVLDLQAAGPDLPNWWSFGNQGSCRQTSAAVSFDFLLGPSSCFDVWQGAATWSWTYDVGGGGANRARVFIAAWHLSTILHPVPAGVEAYGFMLTIDHAKTVGADACADCLEGVCLVLNEIEVTAYPQGVRVLTSPLSRNYVTWQNGSPACPGATPVRNKTWGRVKSLYR